MFVYTLYEERGAKKKKRKNFDKEWQKYIVKSYDS